jgi:hypothetical protein
MAEAMTDEYPRMDLLRKSIAPVMEKVDVVLASNLHEEVANLLRDYHRLHKELLIKKQRIRFLEKANESWAEKFDRLEKKK